MYRRTYLKVDLEAMKQNITEVKKHLAPNVKLLVVVKANAYGHGSVKTAEYLRGVADYFAVATLEEAMLLRENNIQTPILILGYTSVSEYADLIKYHITQTIYSVPAAAKLAEEANFRGEKAKVHIAVDTGMTRIGFRTDAKGIQEAIKVCQTLGIEVEGIFTHLAKADELDDSYTEIQMKTFDCFIEALRKAGITVPLRHIYNSAGIMKYHGEHYDMVRSGIITYGMYPSTDMKQDILSLRPALEWKAHIIHVSEVGAGVKVGYGGTYITQKPTQIATVSVGYADGYPRSLSNCGEVLIHQKRAKIIGRICMDQMMVDVSDIQNIKIEDDVTLLGREGDEYISIEELGLWSHRFNYEFACNIGERVERCYGRE